MLPEYITPPCTAIPAIVNGNTGFSNISTYVCAVLSIATITKHACVVDVTLNNAILLFLERWL